MRKLPFIILLAIAFVGLLLPACADSEQETVWNAYADWREKNEAWVKEQAERTNDDGSPYFKQLVAPWDPSAFVLIHYFNDREETKGNLSPLYTSEIDTRYYVTYYEGTPLDSSYNITIYGKQGIFRTKLNEVIEGWAIAFQDMRVGDTAEVVIPYAQAYGASTSTQVPPYSALKYNVSLVDIYTYEVNPD